jgi:hypothetical protein
MDDTPIIVATKIGKTPKTTKTTKTLKLPRAKKLKVDDNSNLHDMTELVPPLQVDIISNEEYDDSGSSIIHLKIHSDKAAIPSECDFNNTKYSVIETEPSPYDPAILDNCYVSTYKKSIPIMQHIEETNDVITATNDLSLASPFTTNAYQSFYYDMIKCIDQNKIMADFEISKHSNSWPIKTSIACMWCCHEFPTPPCGIPTNYLNGKYYLSGCYCSYNCAAAAIMDSKDSSKWTQYTLLHSLFKNIHIFNNFEDPAKVSDITITPAPTKLILKKFGGIYSIEEYRENMHLNKFNVKIILPPLIFISPKIYEYSFKKEQNTHDYIYKTNQ